LISDLTRIRTISEMNRSLGWGDRPRRLNARRAQKRPARTTSLAVTGASSNATLPLWDWQGCTAMPRGVGHSLDVRQWVCQEEGGSDLVGGFVSRGFGPRG
jgi:hypothetical protein